MFDQEFMMDDKTSDIGQSGSWTDAWDTAEKLDQIELERQIALGEEFLLGELEKNGSDVGFIYWKAIGAAGSAEKFAIPMFKALLEGALADMPRILCAEALAKITGMNADDDLIKKVKNDYEGAAVWQENMKVLWNHLLSKNIPNPAYYSPVFKTEEKDWQISYQLKGEVKAGVTMEQLLDVWRKLRKHLAERLAPYSKNVVLEEVEIPKTPTEASMLKVKLSGLPSGTSIECMLAKKISKKKWEVLSSPIQIDMIKSLSIQQIIHPIIADKLSAVMVIR